MFSDTLPPVDWSLSHLRCLNSNNTIGSFLGFQGSKTVIDVLEGGVHFLWGQSVGFNLREHEVFRHFEEALGHATFLGMGNGKSNHCLLSQHFY